MDKVRLPKNSSCNPKRPEVSLVVVVAEQNKKMVKLGR